MAGLSNTASLQTDFNVDPYYDDFDESKNFYRLLFRPGLGLQSREVTQMQTMLQNQIDRFAEHIFKEGSVVRGCTMTYNRLYPYVRIRDNDSANASVTASNFLTKEITGGTSGVKGIVRLTNDGAEANTPHTKTLFVTYTDAGSNNGSTTFTLGEKLTSNAAGVTANVITAAGSVGDGSAISITEGVIFAKDHFIRVDAQTLPLEKYQSNNNFIIGYDIAETIVDSDTDSTLLDPANGSYNFAAPGANRLKLVATLTKKAQTDQQTNNFIRIAETKNGVLIDKIDKPQYAAIKDYIAQRTFDESGNYIVRGLSPRLREHLNQNNNQGFYTAANGGNNNKLVVEIEPGKAYVYGFDIETIVSSQVPLDKGTDTSSQTGAIITANYGNYVNVRQNAGLFDLTFHDTVSLRDASASAVSNTTYSSSGTVGLELGTARVRGLAHSSGTPGAPDAVYKMYLYDIKMTSNTFSSVRSIYYNDSNADGYADVALSAANNAVLTEPTFNQAIFAIPAKNVQTLANTDYRFYRQIGVNIATDGTFTIASPVSGEVYPYSDGVLNATQKRAGFHLVMRQAANTGAQTGTVAMSDSGNTITGSGTAFDTEWNVGEQMGLQGPHSNTYTITAISSATSMTTLESAREAIVANTYYKFWNIGQVVDLGGFGADTGSRTVTTSSSGTSAAFDINETLSAAANAEIIIDYKKDGGVKKSKTLRSGRYVRIDADNATANATVKGPFPLGFADIFRLLEVRKHTAVFSSNTQGVDVTNDFELDNGQRDNLYQVGSMSIKGDSTFALAAGDWLLAKVDYFVEDTTLGVGFYSVDSYPVDDANTANTTAITTQEIPQFTSPVTGATYPLRDSIDIRPRVTDTGNNATTAGAGSVNPAYSTTISVPSGGLRFSVPNEDFTTDLDYYLGRKDLVVLDVNGQFRVIKGISALYPRTPQEPTDGMTLARIDVAPYPSLPAESGRRYARPGLTNTLSPIRHERFTMRDIGGLKSRVENLEYYTSLSLLERDAAALMLPDSSGIDRFKNGILVDNFTGHRVGDVHSLDYKASVDPSKGELRPLFKLDNIELVHSASKSSNVQRSANDVTLSIASSSATYSNGEAITVGSATGTLIYQTSGKLYLEQTAGAFSNTANAVGGTSGATSVISGITTPTDGELITLPYTHQEIIDQRYASTSRVATQSDLNFVGTMSLDPTEDYWFDDIQRPDVQVNFDLNADNWENLANAWETQWGDWETVWSGTNSSTQVRQQGGNEITTVTTTTSGDETRDGITATVVPETREVRLGNRLVDVNIIPFMRSRVINFTAYGIKPSTRMYSFFDSQDVSSYVSPANSSFSNTAVEGGAVVASNTGIVYGNFRIPAEDAMRFRTGTKSFRITDSPTNLNTLGATTTAAEAQYTAQGLTKESSDTVLSIRTAQVQFESTTETRGFSSTTQSVSVQELNWGDDGDGGDPLAQTFKVSADSSLSNNTPGVFVTKIDLYFHTKDPDFQLGVEIREVDPSTSYITQNVLPFSSKILEPADINVSEDSSAPTPITFPGPVYLLNNKEYAIVIRPVNGSGKYRVWTGRQGDLDLATGNRIVQNAFTGQLLVSTNDRTFSAIQEEDLKFKLYVANFAQGTTGTIIMNNANKEFFHVSNVSAAFSVTGETVHGETTLIVGSAPTINTNVYASGGTSLANGVVTLANSTTIRVRDVVSGPYTDAETITFYHANGLSTSETATLTSSSFPSGKVFKYDASTQSNTLLFLSNTSGTFGNTTNLRSQGDTNRTAKITNIKPLDADAVFLHAGKFDLAGTTTTFALKLASSTSALDSAFLSIPDNDTFPLLASKLVLPKSIENAALTSNSVVVQGTMTTTNRYHSPAVDVKRIALNVIKNKINNDVTGEDGKAGGNAEARYITRKVTLAENQDAEDIRVILDAYKPSTSEVRVYYKILNKEDSDVFSDLNWVQMTQNTLSTVVSDGQNREDFKEYEYVPPTASLTGANNELQYTNSQSVTFTGYKYIVYKIVSTSSTRVNVPRVKNFRAISLQV
jgi:hypothetical protein